MSSKLEIEELKLEISRLKNELTEKENLLNKLKNKCHYNEQLSTEEIVRYSRQMMIPDVNLKGQVALKNSKVLVVGVGGLGCPAALYLAAAGVGEISLMDYDEVELSNLHRQILHGQDNVNAPKVDSAQKALNRINSSIKIIPLKEHANSETMTDLLNKNKYDVILDCTDNVASRYLLNDASVLHKIPLVSGSALRMEGQLTVYNYQGGPCYRCLFPSPPPAFTVTNCGDGGVLGAVPGVIGVLQALETIKVITKSMDVLSGSFLIFDGSNCSFRKIKLRQRNPKCVVCGDEPTITSLIDYEQFCGSSAHDKFQNLLGTVYKKGDLLFTPDGNSVISTVGNRISIFDLKNNKSTTLPVESRYNYNALDLSPNGCTLVAINEEGEAHMISLISQTIVHKYRFKRKVQAVRFSPDGKHFAVCKENNVFVFKAPGPFSGEYNAFVMERVFHGAYDETTCLDWSSDSRILAVGSKDMATKLYPLDKWANFRIYSLGNHTDGIVGCFFEESGYDITTISRNGQTCIWECTVDPKDMVPLVVAPPKKRKKNSSESEEDGIDISKSLERTEEEITKALSEIDVEDADTKTHEVNKLFYKRLARHYLADEVRKENRDAVLTSAAYHKKSRILVTGYSTGAFFIHELPDLNLIHSLSISDQKISSIALNQTGDWIALGCSGLGQLLVWEWQSETYVMKQQGHANNMSCVSYSTDGQSIATGGEDGKVKLWNLVSGFCFVTFSEHTNAVSAIAFSGSKKYRNFRTFTSTRPVQFSCVAVDSSGEFVAAGGQDIFEIYLWSMKTGRLLEILAGHEGPVSGISFSPTLTSTAMVSVSWDKTLKVWDAIEKGSAHETIHLTADGVCCAFKPDGLEVAVGTLDGQITVFHLKTAVQVSSIEGRNDLGSGRSFTSLCYSADGECLLAGGQSKNVCIYNVKESLLLKKFEITQNRSLDAVDDFMNRCKLTNFDNIALIEESYGDNVSIKLPGVRKEEREDREGGNVSIKLPGVRKGDLSGRSVRPEVRVFSLRFSPTGQSWAAATTEGMLVYSLNGSGGVFDPWELQLGITPMAVREAVEDRDFANALIMSMKLNEVDLIQEVIESTPPKDKSSRHLEYYLHWAQQILTVHGPKINAQKCIPTLLALEKSLVRKNEQISKICNYNKYTLQYVSTLGDIFSKKEKEESTKMEVESDQDDELSEEVFNY
ncbi:unnamed protein product [Phaedon cochleariae]|uniref:Ubiquitin-like protein activator 4 homolog n=1 Tax=Phaedon cochleariae TaxID=80249 RepID=A0A9N9SMJ6_PHACE|nr:unnamed protein product [Phaedon cochleariae]